MFETYELVTEVVEVRKELTSQNGQLEIQEKRINNKDEKILVREPSHSGYSEMNKEKSAFDPIYIDQSSKTKKQ